MKFIDNIKLYYMGFRDDFSKAQCYETGLHVNKNIVRAFKLYQQAMQQGDARAYFRMAQWHQENGRLNQALEAYCGGAIRNHVPSRRALEKFAADKNVEAIYLMGKVFIKDLNWERAIGCYKTAVTMKHPDAMYELGNIYREERGDVDGRIKIKKNIVEVLGCYRRAATEGSKYALNELVEMSSSNGLAAFHLAEMYRQGEGGLCSNSLRTFFYYAIAARQNHPDAQRYLEQQVKSGDADAQYTWGYYYYLEKGAISEGIHWCVKAEMQGHQQALTYLE